MQESTTYDESGFGGLGRLQPTTIQVVECLSAAATACSASQSLLQLRYNYLVSGSPVKNNGNVRQQTITAGGSTTFSQSYDYDVLNRLSGISETAGVSQTYAYDQYGNRWVQNTNSAAFMLSPQTPKTQNWFNASTNRLVGANYDPAGNLLDSGAYTLAYDGENRVVSSTLTTDLAQPAGQQAGVAYQYDGEGRRVMRTVSKHNGASMQVTKTVYVQDAFGKLVAEYSTEPQTDSGTQYLTADTLGSTRLVTTAGTGASGVNVLARYDFLPFGEDLPRSVGMGYGAASTLTEKFTGKERDAETGLDYFGARYMSGAQGRFTSADPLLSSAHILSPQSWNRYSYALNNPLRFTDPYGLYVCNGTSSECKDFESALKDVERARNSYKKGSAQYNALNGSLQAYGKKGVDNGVTVQFGATRSGGAGDTNIGIAIAAGTGSKVVTADNPSGQNTVVTFDLAKNNGSGLLAVSAAHEGVHVGDGTALVGALPMDLTGGAAAGVLGGAFNLTKYATEFSAYGASSFTGQGLGFGSLKVGGNFEIWNSGWKAADVNTLRSNGINGVLSDPNGLYKVTPGAPGKKLIE